MSTEDTLKCSRCGGDFPRPSGGAGDPSKCVCPDCQAKAGADDLDRPLLAWCPVCAASPIKRAKPVPTEHRFVCGGCSSVLEESIFGYRFIALDPAFKRETGDYAGKTFTLPDLAELAKARRSAVKGPEEASADEAAAEAGPEAPAVTEAGGGEAPLYWRIDEEALAKREKEKQSARKGVTVDDLLKELSQEKKKK